MLLRAVVAIATNLLVQPANGQQQQPGAPAQYNTRPNGPGRGQEPPNLVNGAPKNEVVSPSDEEIDAARSREISAKAVTGSLVLLLKWLKLSRTYQTYQCAKLTIAANLRLRCPKVRILDSAIAGY